MTSYKVYGDTLSGNCYKIKLLMQFLGLEHDWVHVDILAGETHTAEFLAMNSNAKIPLLAINGAEFLAESNAILNYLAQDTNFLPATRLERAQVLQWQFFEQYSHEPYIAVARFINTFLGMPASRKEEYMAKQEGDTMPYQSWSNSWRFLVFWWATLLLSPISVCTPTPMWPRKVASN